MPSENCLTAGASVFSYLIVPEKWIHDQMGAYYKENPLGSRIAATPLALISGVVKFFLFPLICLIGVVIFPIIAVIRACQDKKGNGAYLTAWAFSVLGAGASAAFVGVITFYLPLVASAGLLITLLSITISYHVYRLVKEPSPSPIL